MFLFAEKKVLGSFLLMYLQKHLQLNGIAAGDYCLMWKLNLV